MDGRLQVRNLALATTDDEVRTLFAQVGDVLEVSIIRDTGSGISRRYGFVTMSALSEADAAISRFNDRLLNGLALKVTLCEPRSVRGQSSR